MGEAITSLKRPNFVYYYGYDLAGAPIKIYKERYEEGLEIIRNFQNYHFEYLLCPRPLHFPLKYLDKKKWINETLRAERNSYGDNFVTRPDKEDDDSRKSD